MSQQDDLQYDEDDAVKFIRNFLPGEVASKFSDDDINYVIDLIYEFYESKDIWMRTMIVRSIS